MATTFDFIIVGGMFISEPSAEEDSHQPGGTAGCLLAHRLANASTRPSVLLIEAGAKPEGDTLRAPYHRYTPGLTRQDLDHGYVTVPQKELNGREIPYQRGKGLGGTSILNFMGWWTR